MRIHVLGASGSGTSTLGRALAVALGAPFFDADDFYWVKTDPPYRTARPRDERRAALAAAVDGLPSWILSGSMMGWGDVVIPAIDLAVYLSVPADLRLARLRAREQAHFGARLAPGGDMHEDHAAFMDWAARYEDGGLDVRSRASHARWLELLTCPVLRVDGDVTTDERVQRVREAVTRLDGQGRPAPRDDLSAPGRERGARPSE
jgi:adenylate kinase family enzyme